MEISLFHLFFMNIDKYNVSTYTWALRGLWTVAATLLGEGGGMDQMTAKHRRHSRHSLCLVRVLLGSLLALSSLAVDTGPIAAHDADQGSSAARPF